MLLMMCVITQDSVLSEIDLECGNCITLFNVVLKLFNMLD